MQEKYYFLGFSAFPGIGPQKFELLIFRFGSVKEAWNANKNDLEKTLGKALTEKFDGFRKKFSIEEYVQKLKDKNVWFITSKDKEYPELLKKIKRPPFLLYGKGEKRLLYSLTDSFSLASELPLNPSGSDIHLSRSNKSPRSLKTFDTLKTIAVVGTRKITSYGKHVTEMFTKELVDAGFTIVSGMAMGVDCVSHKTTIENNGKTIAVLGSGVDLCFPSSNISIYNGILKSGGCLISEFPLGQQPSKGSFPSRNRIIAGMSLAVLVTEGAEDSGSLITADYALSFSRRVFAIPGPITSSLSKGPFKLISRGAKLVTSPQDIINELGIEESREGRGSRKGRKIGDTKEERMILKLLENESLGFDEILKKTKIKPAKLGSTLSLMEIKGFIKTSSDGLFSLASISR